MSSNQPERQNKLLTMMDDKKTHNAHRLQLKAALTEVLGGSGKKAVNTTLTCYTFQDDMVHVLANCLFAHPADTEQHYHLFGVAFVSIS